MPRIILASLVVAVFAVACSSLFSIDDEAGTATATGAASKQPPAASKSIGERIRNGAIVGQAVATIIAIGLGGVFAWRRGYLFRYGQPHITIDHEIAHRQVSPGYVQIELTATLFNTSRVKVDFRDALFVVQQLAPADDDYVSNLHHRAFVNIYPRYYQPLEWEYLEEIHRVWNRDELIVEPGASAAVTFEYVLSNEIQAVSMTTHFYNMKVIGKIPGSVNPRDAENRKRLGIWRVSGAKGWNRTTAYDIVSFQLPQPRTLLQARGE